MTVISTPGPLKCRRATDGEILHIGGGPSVAWVVDIGEGWRIIAWTTAGNYPVSTLTNGTRQNSTARMGPGRLTFRTLPIAFERGYEAVRLAEDCAAAGRG